MALDVSLSSTGYTIVQASKGALDVLAFGHIPTNKSASHGERLHTIHEAIMTLGSIYGRFETQVARERGFSRFAASTQAMFKAHGVVEEALHDYTFVDYPPPTVKKMLTGDRKASKSLVADAVQRYLASPMRFTTDDESDAVAIAITHLVTLGRLEAT